MPADLTTHERLPVRSEVKLGEDSFLSDDFLRQLIDVEGELRAHMLVFAVGKAHHFAVLPGQLGKLQRHRAIGRQ